MIDEKCELVFFDQQIITTANSYGNKTIVLLEDKFYVLENLKDEDFPSFHLMINISMEYKDFIKFRKSYDSLYEIYVNESEK